MNARRLGMILGLELYALALAIVQHVVIGLRDAEAMLMLHIPSTHPPLARFLLSLLDGWAYQEIFWRIVFATLLVQAVWLVLDLVRGMSPFIRVSMAMAWLFSLPVILQSGTLMLAPVAALQGLFFVWLLLGKRDTSRYTWAIGIAWLASLFTAYQALLFAPMMWGVMRSREHVRLTVFLIPIALLALYTLTHPLIVRNVTSLWMHGAYDNVMLLLPFLIAGLTAVARRWQWATIGTAVLVPVSTVLLLWFFPHLLPVPQMDASGVLATIGATDRSGAILIAGPFGPLWQYGSQRPVRRYQARFLSEAVAVVCLQPCEELQRQVRWERIKHDPVEVWVPMR